MTKELKPSDLGVVWASGGNKTKPADTKVSTGWVVELPPYETANWIENRQDKFISHVNQMGIPEWDSVTEYQGGISYVNRDGVVYRCTVTNTARQPESYPKYWSVAFDAYGAAGSVQTALTAHISNYNTLSGITNKPVARANLSVYSKAESDSMFAPVQGSQSTVFRVANAAGQYDAVPRGQLTSLIPPASTTLAGITRYATTTEASSGISGVALQASTVRDLYLSKADNLSTLTNKSLSRDNLGVYSKAESDALFAPIQGSQSTVFRVANATGQYDAVPLGQLTSLIPAASTTVSGISRYATTTEASSGISGVALQASTVRDLYLAKADNLSTLTNKSLSRDNLGLGDSATKDVGTVSGTVAAGNDSRIVNSVQNTRQVIAGNGLTGGGSLSTNVTLALGTPSTLTSTSQNTSTTITHTHLVDILNLLSSVVSVSGNKGTIDLGIVKLKWSRGVSSGANTFQTVSFDTPFPNETLHAMVSSDIPTGSQVELDSYHLWCQTTTWDSGSVEVFCQGVGSGLAGLTVTPFVFAIGR